MMEPYKVKVVEPLPLLSRSEREHALREAGYNLFKIPADKVTIDLLTDSGTGAMSAQQWASLHIGDESYAGARSYRRFETVITDLTGHNEVIPVHQGRAAEGILFPLLLGAGKDLTVSNGHFETTRANVEIAGGDAIDLPCPESNNVHDPFPFKGNLDLAALRTLLAGPETARVAAVILTVTDNAGGGHPVAVDHMTDVKVECQRHDIPLLLDAARFAENAYLISVRDRSPQREGWSPRRIAQHLFSLADGSWCSLKKDAFGNIGGFLTLTDPDLAARCRERLVATEGYPTYGGLAGRDLEALAVGLLEATDPDYLAHRAATARWFADGLSNAGMPVTRPAGCHAVYLDAGTFLPHLAPQQFPAVALGCALYVEGGIRSAEIGTLAFGRTQGDGQPDLPARRELLRLALPRRVYTRGHLEHVIATAAEVVKYAADIRGYRIVRQPTRQRHFTAVLKPLA